MPSPSLAPVRSFDDSSKSTSELASDLMSSLSLREDQIMPFNNPNFVANTLRSISPAVVYFEEELLTRELAEELLRGGAVQTVVLVIGGDEIAGLVSSDEESNERKKGKGKWWEEGGEVRTRLGRRLQVLESWVLDSDWHRRMEDFEETH